MYNLTFSKNDFELIGECVIQTISDLRAASNKIQVQEATRSIELTINRCNLILRELTKIAKIEEESHE